MSIIKKLSQILLIVFFLSSCKTSINKEFPKKYLEKNINEKPNSEKKRIEIKFSCGENDISEYLDDGWNILKEDVQEKICTWKSFPATKDCNMENKRIEIKFSCGEDGIKEYLDNGWIIFKKK